MIYAFKHDYPDILNIAAPLVVRNKTLSETVAKLPGALIIPWVLLQRFPSLDYHGFELTFFFYY